MAEFQLLLGESLRTLDERYRLTLPQEMADLLLAPGEDCILAKERPGCLSLWNAVSWREKMDAGVDLVRKKIASNKMDTRLSEVQLLGRLLSTRQKDVKLAGRSRLVIPEGFREFLRVEPGQDVVVVGAAVCLEFWQQKAWQRHLDRRMPRFRTLLDRLSS